MPVRFAFSAWSLLLAFSVGCASFGPRTLERTQGRYNDAVHRVEQEEFLGNLVRMRYNDTPTSLNLSSIAAQYELMGQAEARPFFIAPNSSNGIFKKYTSILPDALIESANRPTLSFVPGDDAASTLQFLTPVPLETLLFLQQSGWPGSTILRLWVERLNGVPNASTASNPPRGLPPDYARFQRIAELMQIIQDGELGTVRIEEHLTEVSGPIPAAAMTAAAAVEATKSGLEYRTRDDGRTWVLVRPGRQLALAIFPGKEVCPELLEFEALLNLQPGHWHYELTTTAEEIPDPQRIPSPPTAALKVMPRSCAQVYYYLSNGVEVPDEHLNCGIAPITTKADGAVFDAREVTRGLFATHVATGHKPPPYAYVAVRYRGYWFYIDDRDQASKTTFGMVLQLSRLDFHRQNLGAGPLLTLPAGR